MFITDKNSKRSALFTKGDKVVLRINREGLSEAQYYEAREIFGEIWEVMYFSYTHQNWICQSESGIQCKFNEDKIEKYEPSSQGI
jgi:hypothetical protein